MEASGRQPEVASEVRTSMLIAAALIEGATFFALAICIILATKS
jgi:F-type H+-transporting ATPase subunit c